MEIKLNLVDGVHFKASNQNGNAVEVDGSAEIGGQELAMRPVELLLVSLASCSSMDAVTILKKGRNTIDSYSVEVIAKRNVKKTPSTIEKVHMNFIAGGSFNERQLQRAVDLSVTKYCTVAEALDKNIEITYETTLI